MQKTNVIEDAEVQYNLGSKLYNEGNTQEAKIWFKIASENGNNEAQLVLGAIFDIEGNNQEAKKWFIKAAQNGNTQAQTILVGMFLKQTKLTEDANAEADFNLGTNFYKKGYTEEAKKHFKEAADKAQEMLGILFKSVVSFLETHILPAKDSVQNPHDTQDLSGATLTEEENIE